MQNRVFKAAAIALTVAGMAVGGGTLAHAAAPATPADPATTMVQEEASSPDLTRAAAQQLEATDFDDVQEENGAEDANEVGEAEEPESGDHESATEDDGPGGHADEPENPNASHEFDGQE